MKSTLIQITAPQTWSSQAFTLETHDVIRLDAYHSSLINTEISVVIR
jgi:hypothetical protein